MKKALKRLKSLMGLVIIVFLFVIQLSISITACVLFFVLLACSMLMEGAIKIIRLIF